jgi:hypothetical protein
MCEEVATVALSVDERSKVLAQGFMRMQAFDEQYKAFLSELQRLAERSRNSVTPNDTEYTLGFKTGVANAIQHIFDKLLMLYGDVHSIQEKISVAVRG